jgi:sulfate/thiosulfate transport system ATP-binding protein
MTFIGAVNRLGDSFVRPHDVEIHLTPNGDSREAIVKRVLYLGFEVRVELALRDGQELWAQVSRNDIEGLKLAPGQAIYITPTREKVFA